MKEKKIKVKKPFYKKWWVWLLAIIIIGAAATGGEDEKETAKKEDKAVEATAKTNDKKEESKKEPKKEEKSYKIGDKVKVGDMEYTITKKDTADQVGPSILPTKANEKFVVLEVTLKNNGNEAVTVDSSFFKLKLGDKTYEADNTGSISANQSDDGSIDNSFFLQSLNPDSEMNGKVVFDVAEDVANRDNLQVQVQTGVFGTETDVINLK